MKCKYVYKFQIRRYELNYQVKISWYQMIECSVINIFSNSMNAKHIKRSEEQTSVYDEETWEENIKGKRFEIFFIALVYLEI